MLRLDKVIKPWKEAAALCDHINLYGFWNETAFLTKSGDLGMVLSVAGVDYESLDHAEQEYAVKRLEAALKSFGPGFHVYQYLFKSNRPEIPFADYENPLVQESVDYRRRFFEEKADRLYEIEIYYCVLLEGSRSKTGVGAALAQLFRDPAGAVNELKTQFTNNAMKTLLRTQIERDLARLEQCAQAFVRQLADFVHIDVLNQRGQFRFFRRLLNYDDWRIAGHTKGYAVSRLPGGQLRHRSRTRSPPRGRPLRPDPDDEGGHRRDPAAGAGRAAEGSGELLCRHRMGAAHRGEGAQRSQQAPEALQRLEDRLRVATRQRPGENEPARRARWTNRSRPTSRTSEIAFALWATGNSLGISR